MYRYVTLISVFAYCAFGGIARRDSLYLNHTSFCACVCAFTPFTHVIKAIMT